MSAELQIGQLLPKLEVLMSDGQKTTVQTHLGPRQTLLYFLHGTWCPGCVGQFHLLQRYLPRIKEAAAKLVVLTSEEIEALTAFLGERASIPGIYGADRSYAPRLSRDWRRR